MPAWAPEPIVEFHVTNRRIEIVTPQEPDNTAAEPYAFRLSGRPLKRIRRFGEFVSASLRVLAAIRRLVSLLLGLPALCHGRP